MVSRSTFVLALACVLAAGPGCRRHAAPPVPRPLPQTPAPFASPPTLPGTPNVAALVEKVRPTVVNITALHEVEIPAPWQGWPFGGRGGDDVIREGALGSGFIVDREGHVVTNAHVVAKAETVRIKLADDREFRARIVAKDERMDIAVLKLEGSPHDLPVSSLGSSDALRVGDYVVAIGNPFGLGDSVTMGIVSAKGRALGAGPYDDFIQTDAPINPGNSGGPLFDLRGQVVGISTAINPQGQGIGFAIPIDEVKRELPELIATGSVSHARLGVAVQELDDTLARAVGLPGRHGALVAHVLPGGAAAQAGIRPGDVIVAIDGHDVGHAVDLSRMIGSLKPGSHARVTIFRDRQTRDIPVTLGALPNGPEGAASKQAPEPRESGPTGSLGIAIADAPGGGAIVEGVNPRGAAGGKLAPGDVIESVDMHSIGDARDLVRQVAQAPGDRPILLRVRRDHQSRYVAIDRQVREPPG